MAKVILGATMSIDGYINDRNGSVEMLYPDLEAWHDTESGRASMQNTGAVVMGRHTFNMSEDPDWFADNYEYQVPIFVLTHRPPVHNPRENGRISFIFITDGIESAVQKAKAAAGGKWVNIIGAPTTARQVLEVGLADELHIDIMPVLLNGGSRMFESSNLTEIQMERLNVLALPGGRIHMEFRIRR